MDKDTINEHGNNQDFSKFTIYVTQEQRELIEVMLYGT
jgi:hypothetical protein